MHEPSTIDSERYTPGKGGGAAAQQVPIRAVVETIILPPAQIPKAFVGAGQSIATGLAVPSNHALWIANDGNVILTLSNPGDPTISIPLVPGLRRIIPIRQIGVVHAVVGNNDHLTLWIEDLRAMEPWICRGEYRP